MKCVAIAVIVACVVALAQSQVPTKSCPPGEHSVLYCPPVAEPTCDRPYIHKPFLPKPCDLPECFCNTGTIRKSDTNECVDPKNC